MVVHVVVLLRAIVLAGVGVVEDDNGCRSSVTRNISPCDCGPILFRTFIEPTDAFRLTWPFFSTSRVRK